MRLESDSTWKTEPFWVNEEKRNFRRLTLEVNGESYERKFELKMM